MVGDRMIQLQHRVNYGLVVFPWFALRWDLGLSCGWSAGSRCPWKEERLERQARPERDLETKQRIRAPQNLESTNPTSQGRTARDDVPNEKKRNVYKAVSLCLRASGFEYTQIIDLPMF
jgi:hypothetical protein